MATQIWTPFTADRSILAGGQALGAGIGGGLSSLGDALGKAMDRKKQEAQLAGVLRKKHGILQPDRKDEFTTMSLADLIGEDKAHIEQALEADRAQERQVREAQLAQLLETQANQRRAPAFFQRMAEAGQAPENVPSPLSNSEFSRRTTPLGPGSLFEAMSASGYNPPMGQLDDLMRSIAAGQPKPARGLPLGETRPVGELGTIIGTGEEFEPNFVGKPKPGDQPAPNYPWLLDDDVEKFKKGLRTITDPAERDSLIEARNKYEIAKGRPSLQERLLMEFLGRGAGASGGKGGGAGKRYWNPETGILQDTPYAPGR